MNIDDVAPILVADEVVPAAVVPVPTVPVVPAAEPEPKLVQLSQARLDELIRDSMSRAGRAAKDEAVALKRENEHLKSVAAGSAEGSTELEKTKAELSAARLESDSLRAMSQKQSKDVFIAEQAQKNDFLAQDIVVRLTRDNLTWNGTGYTVVDDSGSPRTAADGSPLAPEAFFQEYALQRPYLVKGLVKTGGGGTSSSGTPAPVSLPLTHYFGVGSSAQAANALSIQRPDEYRRLRKEAVRLGILAGSN